MVALAPFLQAGLQTVGPAGSGAQYTEIQAAIDAAQDGDTVLVLAGTYQQIVVDKPLRILSAGLGPVRIAGLGFAARVHDIGFDEELVLSGLQLRATSSLLPVLQVEDSIGTVVLHDLVLPVAEDERPGLLVENCARVFLLDSLVRGGVLGGFGRRQQGAVVARTSQLWIAGSELEGTDGDAYVTQQGAHGLEVETSEVFLWSTRILAGGSGRTLMGSSGDGGTGLRAVTSRLQLFGGPQAEIRGGNGAFEGTTSLNYSGGPGLDLLQGSLARIQATLPIQGGFDGRGLIQASGVQSQGTSSFTLEPRTFPTVSATPSQAALGTSFTVTLNGTPGALQSLVLSFRTGPTTIFRHVEGYALLSFAQFFQLAAQPMPASGTVSFNLNVPASLSLLGRTLYLQNIERSASGFALGNLALVAIAR